MQTVVVSRTRDKFLVFTNRIIISYFICIQAVCVTRFDQSERVICVGLICIHPTFISCDSSAGHGSFHSLVTMASICMFVFFCSLNSALSAKIAGLSGIAAGSHYFIIRSTMEELLSRGHEVSLSTPSNELKHRSTLLSRTLLNEMTKAIPYCFYN